MNATELRRFVELLPELDFSWSEDRQALWWEWFVHLYAEARSRS
jgi:hypothetical protein